MTEILKEALIISEQFMKRKCCNKEFHDFVKHRITLFQQNYFPDNKDFIEEFYLNINNDDPCLHITYIAGLFKTVNENLIFA